MTAQSTSTTYLPKGLPAPTSAPDGLAQPFWDGTRQGKLMVQKCKGCGTHQWGPEWICHKCHSFDLDWVEVGTRGRIYSYEKPHHPVHAALVGHGPYIIVLVDLDGIGVRMLGNLLGDPAQKVEIGAAVEAVFEPHDDADPPYTLVQWKRV